MPALSCLEIKGVPLTAKDLEPLMKLKGLTYLAAIDCGLDDDCINVLSKHPFVTLLLDRNKRSATKLLHLCPRRFARGSLTELSFGDTGGDRCVCGPSYCRSLL